MRDLFGARPGSEIDRIAREWVQRVALRQMTAAQADALRQWCQADPRHGAAFAEAHRLWQGMAPGGAERARGRERRLSRPARRAFLGAGLACAATGQAWPWLRRHSACGRPGAIGRRLSHRQGRAAPRRIAGAAVLDLNTRTSIALRAAGVELISGEAAISLAGASSPFTVSAAGGRVMAQDAVFELRHTDGSVCVTCLSGAVEVALASGGATLAAAQRLVYDAAGLQPARALDADDLPAWREGFLRFRQAPLAQVLDEINRYRSGRVILMAQSLAARPVSVRVELARLDTAIAQIRENFQLDATALPGGVLLLG